MIASVFTNWDALAIIGLTVLSCGIPLFAGWWMNLYDEGRPKRPGK